MTFEARDSAAKVVPATATNHVEDPANPQKVITFVFLLTWPLKNGKNHDYLSRSFTQPL